MYLGMWLPALVASAVSMVADQTSPQATTPVAGQAADRVISTVKFRIAEHELYPESIAHDPVSGDFFLSSMGQSRILRIRPDGSYSDFVSGKVPELASSIGMKVDAKRRHLWVCTGRYSLLERFASTAPRTGVLLFDIDSGKLKRTWLHDEEQQGPFHIFNDVAVAASGEAFVTTTLLGSVYKIKPRGKAMTRIHQLDAGSHNNGITLGPKERYVFVTVDRRIYRMDRRGGAAVALDVPDDAALGTDGLYYHDGTLILIKPRFNEITRLVLGDDLLTVSRVETLVDDHPDMAYPTTGVVVGDRLVYVATSFADKPRRDEPGPQHGDVLIHEVSLVPPTPRNPTTTK